MFLSQLNPAVSICCSITCVLEQENIVTGNYFLNKSAKEAYRSYLLAYNSHSMKDIFDIHQLDLKVNVCDVLSQCSVIGVCSFLLAQHFASLQVLHNLKLSSRSTFVISILLHCKFT